MYYITMCRNSECKAKFKCYRYIAKLSQYNQVELLFDGITDKCDMFWPVSETPKFDKPEKE